MTRAEEHAEKVRRLLPDSTKWPDIKSEKEAEAALSDLVADAEALAEALEPFTDPHNRTPWTPDKQRARKVLARYRGEKP